jgi:N-acetylmuramoyl-L-alanine amidase
MFRPIHVLFCAALAASVPFHAKASGRAAREPAASAHAEGWTTLKAFAKEHGFDRVDEEDDRWELRGPRSTLVLYKDSRRAEVDKILVWLNDPLELVKGKWCLSNLDVEKSLEPILRPVALLAKQGHRLVVLDPGHGGKDSGAESAAGLLEKTVALDIAERVRKHLEGAGYKVVLTRDDDTFLELAERAKRAKDWKADLFVSIHLNSVDRYDAAGVETFALSLPGHPSTNDPAGHVPSHISHPGNRHDAANAALCFLIQKSLVEGNQVEDRGLRRARFQVLRQAECPAALVECGFLSNPREAGRLSVAYYREKMALSLAQGVDNYLREVKKAVLAAETLASPEASKP